MPLTLLRHPAALERQALGRAAFIVATTVLDAATLPDRDVIAMSNAQSAVERGLACLTDPPFLASSVFVNKPHRLMALAFIRALAFITALDFILALSLLVYRPVQAPVS